jgi:hypothetical protein
MTEFSNIDGYFNDALCFCAGIVHSKLIFVPDATNSSFTQGPFLPAPLAITSSRAETNTAVECSLY